MRAAPADRRRAALRAAGALAFFLLDSTASAQTPAPTVTAPVTAQSASNFSYETKDGQQTVTNFVSDTGA